MEAPEGVPPAAAEPTGTGDARVEALALLTAIFLVAACGLIYELLIATVSSYLVGSSVTQFSLSVGLFVGSMGLGSWLSQRIRRKLLGVFFFLELALAAVGGISAPVLFAAYGSGPLYWVVLLGLLILIGTLVGIELPLLVRLLDRYGQLRTIVAQALSFDYLGSLAGSLLFPLVLLPILGIMRTSFAVGVLNVGVALYTFQVFRTRFRGSGPVLLCLLTAGVLACGFAFSLQLSGFLEARLYDDQVIYSRQTPYQRIVFTRWREDFRLFLDGNIQFSSVDEYRYHETLVHLPLGLTASREHVLVLGGGDGLAIREVLRWPDVRQVTLVDLDPEMTRLGRSFPPLRTLNRDALHDPRVRVVNQDAHRFLEAGAERFGAILTDLPDPNGDALAKLYSREFYRLARRRLGAGGVLVTQAGSPFFSREAFWCIEKTMAAAGFRTRPIHTYVPSFGDWGWVLGADRPLEPSRIRLPAGLQYLTPELLATLPVFGPDTGPTPVEVSTVDHPRVLRYYLDSARRWD
ncbi:MAG: polyamine aminopropyltransferase [Armatimonadetes bacterium]|nr:polyamine aminopropyltransferase [Armatimonadota bacterium]